MAKLIFTSRYLKDAKPSQKENYVHYIGTRKGVEKIDTSKKHLPATVSQKKLVHQLLQDFPATKEMLEYEDYQRKPTIENASEFISCVLEQNLDIAFFFIIPHIVLFGNIFLTLSCFIFTKN